MSTITIGDRDITVKQLNVLEIRNIMDNMDKEERSIIDLLFPDNIPAYVVSESTGISVSKLESDFLPSELKTIIEKVENQNPFFCQHADTPAETGAGDVGVKNLDVACCRLIRLGHHQVWGYTWGMFETAISEALKENNE